MRMLKDTCDYWSYLKIKCGVGSGNLILPQGGSNPLCARILAVPCGAWSVEQAFVQLNMARLQLLICINNV